jgi:hypothetical protein
MMHAESVCEISNRQMKADRRLSLVVRVAIERAAQVCLCVLISAGTELVVASLVMHHGAEAVMAQANADIGEWIAQPCHAKRMDCRPVIDEQRNKKRLVVCTTSRRKISEGVIKTTSSLQPSLQPS